MKVVCPDGSVAMYRSLSADLKGKLEQLGSCTWFDDHPETSEIYLERVKDADGILALYDVPAEVLGSCSSLQIISYLGIDPRKFVDLSLATKKRIVVTNTPHYGDHAVAEHTLALILCCAKRITQLHVLLHQGVWEEGLYNTELWGKILGLVGLGGIGGEVARLAQAFGMQVLCWTPHPTRERAKEYGVEFINLKELFKRSDVVTLHLRHTPDTERLITRELLELLKPGAILVNTARAELMDNQALAELIMEKKIGAVGLDVYDVEPIGHDSPFLEIENVILTPHIAYNTPEATANIWNISVENLVAFFSGHPKNVVNSEVLQRLQS